MQVEERTRAAAPPLANTQAVALYETALPAIRGAIRVEVERDEPKILAKIRTLAKAAGDNWYYRYPVKNKKTGKVEYVEGPSIKCANTVARVWGNNEIDVRVQDHGDHWIFYARLSDYETGSIFTRAFQQRKGQDTGMKDRDRASDMIFQIGQSKAIRNVVCNALSDITDFAYAEAKSSFVDAVGKDIEKYRGRVIDRLRDLEIEVKRVELVVGRVSKDWLAPDVARIIAELQAVQDGMATVDDTWPLQEPDAPGESQGGGKAKEAAPASVVAEAAQAETVTAKAVGTTTEGALPASGVAVSTEDELVAEWVRRRIDELGDVETTEQLGELFELVVSKLTQDSDAPLLARFLQKHVVAEARLRKAAKQ